MKRYIYPLAIFAVITGVIIILSGHPGARTGPTVREYALLLAVDVAGRSLTAQRVEWLEGEEAVAAAINDHPECTTQNISDCAASLANNFYLDRAGDPPHVFSLKKGVRIEILEGGSAEYQEHSATLRELQSRIEMGPRLVEVQRRGDEVYRLVEVYLP